jgi:hypothetical protein
MTEEGPESEAEAPRWRPLSAIERRVVGVLVEKAKTTPSAYPMSLNAIVTGCNQKSNRHPLMELEPDAVEGALERLREMGAVGMVQGYGRVVKYRHYLYEWLGVDKIEMAVMTELLLRGSQTEGELRGRASRMEAIADLQTMRNVLSSLAAKSLILSLTPEGRGHVITHSLYQPGELEKLKAQYAGRATAAYAPDGGGTEPAAMTASEDTGGGLPAELDEVRSEVAQLRSELAALNAAVQALRDELQSLRGELGA